MVSPKPAQLFSEQVYKSAKAMMEAKGEDLKKTTIRQYLGDYATTNKIELFAEAYATGTISHYLDNITINNDYMRRYFDSTNTIASEYKTLVDNELSKLFK